MTALQTEISIRQSQKFAKRSVDQEQKCQREDSTDADSKTHKKEEREERKSILHSIWKFFSRSNDAENKVKK